MNDKKRLKIIRSDSVLRRIAKLYEENYKFMASSVGTDAHERYVERERQLNAVDISRRIRLGVYLPDYDDPRKLRKKQQVRREIENNGHL